MLNVTLYGPPGGGKGTVALKLIAKYQLFHISTGDICRKRVEIEDTLGLNIKAIIDSGQLVPDEIIIRLFEEVAHANLSMNGCIFDGFPRTIKQTVLFEEFLQKNFPHTQNKCIFLDVSDEELLIRLVKRATIEHRVDDASSEKIKARIETFKELTLPVIDYYRDRGLLTTIVGTGKTPDQVWAEVQHFIDG